MKKIGFIDSYLDEWHANNYPKWIRQSSRAGQFEVALAWQEVAPEGKKTLAQWCEAQGVGAAESLEQVVAECDGLVILAPDDPERHEGLCDLPLRSGKPVFVDKTFAPDLATAQRLFAKAEKHGTPLYSCSALRYVESLESIVEQLAGRRADFVATRGGGDWRNYAVHHLEPLVMLLGTGARRVLHVGNPLARFVVVDYPDGRRGSVLQAGFEFEFNVRCSDKALTVSDLGDFFPRFIEGMLAFFETREAPVPKEQTLEIMALIEAGRNALATPDTWVAVPT